MKIPSALSIAKLGVLVYVLFLVASCGGGGSGSAYTYVDGADGYFKWYAPYANAAALPNATNHHGMFAHTHDTGKAHFAHDAEWIQLVDVNDSINILADVDTTVNGGPSAGQVLKWNGSTTKWEPANDEQNDEPRPVAPIPMAKRR